ncbi:hypothetical protein N7510_002716 [Penicillium lagena]|uniref:uncharacterized protein n=1 Tax=Penicillium lagena TaxID=94218 RepID=UPI00254070EA|nr:uncharacterized protein N7510_002716 [Penicillium lagena]KAJ5626407.1 hypothetical protein N7510_002716 [Penicillium lagena]
MAGKKLAIVIVGAGIAGLAAAIALREKGHQVTVLEAAPRLSDIGAGIQVPPNSVRLLKQLGVYEPIAKLATWPRSITLKRWQNGANITKTPLYPQMEEVYGYPYFLIHRGDLHKVLLDRAYEVGTEVKVNASVSEVNEAAPSVTLNDGTVYRADLLIGADGIKSQVRKAVITDRDVEIIPDPNCAYRTLIPGELMMDDPELKALIESPAANCWIGPEGHIMAYPIRNGALYNFVMCHPGSVPVGKPNERASLDDMNERYKTWDPVICKLIALVPQCLKWQNAEIEKLETWVSKSGKVVLIGDSSHAMVPYMAQGAAMAVEDAVTLAECLDRVFEQAQIPDMMRQFQDIRLDRCYLILDGARNNGGVWHLPDGPAQQERDKKMGEPPKQPEQQSKAADTAENPNKWSDPKFQPWMFGYDARVETISYLENCSVAM